MWRLDKIKNLQIIKNGGWHFSFLQTPENISKKIKSFAHGEYNKSQIVNEDSIESKINQGKDIFDRGYILKKVEFDSTFPKYILKNRDKFKKWIA